MCSGFRQHSGYIGAQNRDNVTNLSYKTKFPRGSDPSTSNGDRIIEIALQDSDPRRPNYDAPHVNDHGCTRTIEYEHNHSICNLVKRCSTGWED